MLNWKYSILENLSDAEKASISKVLLENQEAFKKEYELRKEGKIPDPPFKRIHIPLVFRHRNYPYYNF